jgi:hypothetical protein
VNVEEHEEIPWSMLVDHDRRGRSRTLYLAAAVIVIVIIGFAASRWIEGHRQGETPAETAAGQATTTLPPVPTTTALLSEADLMAVDPETARLAAVARAEWFVTDYFTIDGSPAPDFLAAFPADAVLPELPNHDVGPAVSFVEWARAYGVRPHRDGFVVTVLFRTLYENEALHYERSPVRAVDVIVLVKDESTAIGDLPIPVLPPGAGDISGWMTTSGDAPADAVARALAYAARFTKDPVMAGSGSSGVDWRVVFAVDDPSGTRFPMVVRSDTGPYP